VKTRGYRDADYEKKSICNESMHCGNFAPILLQAVLNKISATSRGHSGVFNDKLKFDAIFRFQQLVIEFAISLYSNVLH